MKNDDFNQQLKNIFLEKYNVENPNQLEEVKQKKVDIELKHFGMLYSRTFKFRQLARENLIPVSYTHLPSMGSAMIPWAAYKMIRAAFNDGQRRCRVFGINRCV